MNRRFFFSRVLRAAAIAVACPVILREALCREMPQPFTIGEYEARWIETTRGDYWSEQAFKNREWFHRLEESFQGKEPA